MIDRIMNNEEIENRAKEAGKILASFDRMPNNPNSLETENVLLSQIVNFGQIRLCLFACPSYNTAALTNENPEDYFTTQVKTPDLFTPRVKKIREIQNRFNEAKIPLNITVFIGDTDPKEYVLPALKRFGINIDTEVMAERSNRYFQDFSKRTKELLGASTEVISLSKTGLNSVDQLQIPDVQKLDEVKFLKWLFSPEGPYKGMFTLTDTELREMAIKKFKEYGKQGQFIKNYNSILLQTETPWLLRTQMLQCAGADFVAIYPWVRKEEL